MTLAGISAAYLRRHKLATLLNVALLACAVAAVTLVLLTTEQLESRLHRESYGVDLVVGPRGSQTQMILSSIYGLEVPSGGIPWSIAQEIGSQPGVASAIPLALADAYKDFRIIGTSHEYLSRYDASLTRGRVWEQPMEAIIGSGVYARLKLPLGATFVASHARGSDPADAHTDMPFRVVGVLSHTGSALDQAIVTGLESFWALHAREQVPAPGELVSEPPIDEGKTVSAILIRYASSDAAEALPRFVDSYSELQAVSPAEESARLFSAVSVGMDLMRGFAIVLMFTAGLSILVALYHGLNERRYDLAVMRTLGATRETVMALLLFEGILLSGVGAVLGMALGHLLTSMLGYALARVEQMAVTGWVWHSNEIWIAAATVLLGFIAALVPAWRAHEVDIAATLARG